VITEEQFQLIVEEVIRRLLARMNDNAPKGSVIVVFTGATVGLVESIRQVKSLLLDGYKIELVFSRSAGHLFAEMVREELSGFPNLCLLSPEKWISSVKAAEVVAVPLLSLNTATKLSLLIADDLVSNILLHSLLFGKPTILAKEGADPYGDGRKALGFNKGNSVLNELMHQRLKKLEELGCTLTGVGALAETAHSLIRNEARGRIPREPMPLPRQAITVSGKIATSGDVLSAHKKKANLNLGPAGLVTPLARDLAGRLGVKLMKA